MALCVAALIVSGGIKHGDRKRIAERLNLNPKAFDTVRRALEYGECPPALWRGACADAAAVAGLRLVTERTTP